MHALVSDSNPKVRREAVLAAARIGATPWSRRGSAITSSRSSRRHCQSRRLRSISTRSPRQFESLPPALQPRAIEMLGRSKTDRHAALISRFLDGSTPQRVAAVTALGRLKAEQYTEQVIRALQDPHPTVRHRTDCRRGAARGKRSAGAICNALSDVDGSVREYAAAGLFRWPSPAALADLTERLDDDYPPARDASLRAMGALGQLAEPPATAMLSDPRARVRRRGSILLGSLQSDAGLTEHIKLLSDDDLNVISAASEDASAASAAPRPVSAACHHRATA